MNIPPQPKINHTTSTYLWKNISFTINLHVGVTFLIFFVKLMCSDWVLKKKAAVCIWGKQQTDIWPLAKVYSAPKAYASPPTALLYHTLSVKDSFPNMSSWSFSSVTSLFTSLLLQPLSITPTTHLSPPHLTAKYTPSFLFFCLFLF